MVRLTCRDQTAAAGIGILRSDGAAWAGGPSQPLSVTQAIHASAEAEEQWLCPASEATPRPNDANLKAPPCGTQPEPPETLSRDRDPREAGQTVGQRRFLELDLRKAPRQEVVVGLHVEVPVSAEVE